MLIPKNSEVYSGVKFDAIVKKSFEAELINKDLTVKYNCVIIAKNGKFRPKSLELAQSRGVNLIASIQRLTKHVTKGNISESDYFDALQHLLTQRNGGQDE